MYTGFIARRYAEALYRFAALNGEAEVVYAQAEEMAAHLIKSSRLKEELFSPVFSVEMKRKIVLGCVGNNACRSLRDFVSLVLKHRRERFLLYMLYSYSGIYEEKNGIARVSLVTAAPVGEAVEGGIADLVRKQTSCTQIKINREVNEALIGGFILKVADKQMDASVATRLGRLRRILSGNL